MVKIMERTTLKKIKRVLEFIKKNPGVHIRGIAKSLNYGPATVDWVIERYLKPFIEIELPLEKSELKEFADIFGLKLKTVKLKLGKENIDLEDVLRYVRVRQQIKKIRI